jgi:hypothetical protein
LSPLSPGGVAHDARGGRARRARRACAAGARRACAAGVARRRHKTLTVWSNFDRLVKKHLVDIRRPAAAG